MKQRLNIHKWLLTAWMLWVGIAAFAAPTTAPAAWRTTPVLSDEMYPAYNFQSTSSYTPIVGKTSYTATPCYAPGSSSSPTRGPRRSIWDDEPDGDELGIINTPIGEPYILLLFALLYLAYKRRKSIRS